MDTTLHLFKAGGMTMIPLVFCSVVALAIVIEKAFALRVRKVIAPRIARSVETLARDEDTRGLAQLCAQVDTPFARVILAALQNRRFSRTENIEMVQAAARHEVGSLERGLTMLEIITGISPLLGLLGTVLGIFHVFNVIVQSGVGEASILSGGISEALVTTIVGLFIAIPSLVAHSYFSKRVDELVLEIERYAGMLMHKLYLSPEGEPEEMLAVKNRNATG